MEKREILRRVLANVFDGNTAPACFIFAAHM
jgi:hypothetical protein